MTTPVALGYEPSLQRPRRYFAWLQFVIVLIAGSGPAIYLAITPLAQMGDAYRDFGLKLPPVTMHAVDFLLFYARYGWLCVVAAAVLAGALTAAWGARDQSDRQSSVVAWVLCSVLIAATTLIVLQRAIETTAFFGLMNGITGGSGSIK